jgi:hypothetical protein
MDNPTCETCRFWKRDGAECHRYPPQRIVFHEEDKGGRMDWNTASWWPDTNYTDWCGEHEPAAVGGNPPPAPKEETK